MRRWTTCFAVLLFVSGSSAYAQDMRIGYSVEDAQNGAQLRSHASALVSVLFNACNDMDAIAVPLQKYEVYKKNLASDAFRMDLTIVESDQEYEASLIDISCADLDAEEQIKHNQSQISLAHYLMDAMNKIVIRQTKGN